jgi:GNAT superfamily N-acetyltransferase
MAAIRLAQPADRLAIEALVCATYKPYVASIGREPEPMLDDCAALIDKGFVNVLEEAGGISGGGAHPGRAYDAARQCSGKPVGTGGSRGRKLVAFAEATARAAGCEAIRLYTNALMTENLAIYRRLGFTETHRGDENGYRRVYMAKHLPPNR